MDGRAVTKFIRISPRKARIVADLLRGKRVGSGSRDPGSDAQEGVPDSEEDDHVCRGDARTTSEAEQARLENNAYFIKEIRIDEGPTMKRIRPRAQGRAFRILKRTSHIRVTVSPV